MEINDERRHTMSRRHLQFLLSGPATERVEDVRRTWDPVMAARAPAHVTLIYPEEFTDEQLLVARTREAASRTAPFSVVTHAMACEAEGDGGVWFLVEDESGSWASLRCALLQPPFRLLLEAVPHITLVHPRTSKQGRAALSALGNTQLGDRFELNEIVFTDTSESGMRVLERFPLRGSLTRVVGAIVRRDEQVLLCLRTRERTSYPGVWDIPGGHVDSAESLTDALIRELNEELGIEAVITSSTPWTIRRIGTTELSVFVVDEWRGELRNAAPDEHDEVRWISVHEFEGLPFAHVSFPTLLTLALGAGPTTPARTR